MGNTQQLYNVYIAYNVGKNEYARLWKNATDKQINDICQNKKYDGDKIVSVQKFKVS